MFIVLVFQRHQLVFVSVMQVFDVLLQLAITTLFISNLSFIVIFHFFELSLISFSLLLQTTGQLVVLLFTGLNIRFLYLLVGLVCDVELLLQCIQLLLAHYIQLLFLQTQLLLRPYYLKPQLFYDFVALLDLFNSLQVQVIGALSDPFSVFRLNQGYLLFDRYSLLL